MNISTDPALLSVDMIPSMNTSPSVSTFMPEEDASICPLLPATPSPPPMDFIHPLTPETSAGNGCGGQDADNQGETSSSSGSSGIVMETNASSMFTHHNCYAHLGKNGDALNGDLDLSGSTVQNGTLQIPITKDMPGFVSWNWPLIRKCTLLLFLAGLFGMCGIVVAMIVNLPRHCNPDIDWYRGGVFYEIFPASFQDSDGDGVGDIKGLTSRIDYFDKMHIKAIRLNSIFPATHYPDHFEDVLTLTEVDKVLGTMADLRELANQLHARNMSLVLDLPLAPLVKQLDPVFEGGAQGSNQSQVSCDSDDNCLQRKVRVEQDNVVLDAMRIWLAHGVDGFYVKGLDAFSEDPYLSGNVHAWKQALGHDRILIVGSELFDQIDSPLAMEIAKSVDLVDVSIDITNGTNYIGVRVKEILTSPLLAPGFGSWVHWSMAGVSERRLSKEMSSNATLAATLAQLMLPGTVNLFYGDEIALQPAQDADAHDAPSDREDVARHQLLHLAPMLWESGQQFTTPNRLSWVPSSGGANFAQLDIVRVMIGLRNRSPTIYQNSVIRDNQAVLNTAIRYNKNDVFILERWYPRRNTFVAISNFGPEKLTLDLTAMFYSGDVMLGPLQEQKIIFNDFKIGPMETIIAKLDK